jgi:hypothetical protein
MKQKTNLTLPEWTFLDASSHLGNELEGRDVLLHVRTHTMLEFFSQNDLQIHLDPKVKQKQFYYKNKFGVIENYKVAIHYSLTEFSDLDQVIESAIEFFKQWMDWMDKSIEQEDNSKIN